MSTTEPRQSNLKNTLERNPTYYAMDPQQWGSFVYGVEKIADISHELEKVNQIQYDETETAYMDHPMDPDYERYAQVEQAGQLIVFTIRDENFKLAGYLIYYLSRSMHVKTVLQAREDAFFVLPESRKNGVGQRLLTYAEDVLHQLNVSYVGMSSKAPIGGPDLDNFLIRNNYKKVAIYYQKRLPDMKAAH